MSAFGRLQAENWRLRCECARLRGENERLRTFDPLGVHAQEDAVTTTVVARIRALGVPPSRGLAWRVGSDVRRAWEKEHGTLPLKANTAKVTGKGSHCHARYPLSWAPRIDAAIARHSGLPTPEQGTLF